MKVGDKVQYTKAWLQSTGQFTGDIPFAKGIVKEIKKLSPECILASVDWNNENIPARVNIKNLQKCK